MENKTPKTEGKCFENNGRWAMDIYLKHSRAKETVYVENFKLVHGLVINAVDEKPMIHCWIEEETDYNQRVYDDTRGDRPVFPKEFYYAMARVNPDQTVKMPLKEAMAFMSKTGHYGPWPNAKHLLKISGR